MHLQQQWGQADSGHRHRAQSVLSHTVASSWREKYTHTHTRSKLSLSCLMQLRRYTPTAEATFKTLEYHDCQFAQGTLRTMSDTCHWWWPLPPARCEGCFGNAVM
jgi:hypothetical protein